jgi:hypothetical protein
MDNYRSIACSASLTGQLLFCSPGPDIHRRSAVEPSKAAIVGNRAQLPLHGLGLAEHTMGAAKAPPGCCKSSALHSRAFAAASLISIGVAP